MCKKNFIPYFNEGRSQEYKVTMDDEVMCKRNFISYFNERGSQEY